MGNFIDFHTHILPGIDDGSPDLATSDKMLDSLASQGVAAVVLTPHFYSDSVPLDIFLQDRDAAFSLLQAHRQGKPPALILGAEVYYSSVLLNYPDLSALTIGNSDYLLLEMSFQSTFSPHTIERLYQLTAGSNTRLIFAHIDRYPPLIKNTNILDQLFELDSLMQANLDAFTSFKKKRKMFHLLESGRIFAVGTDCHNMSSRPPAYEQTSRLIDKKMGDGFIAQLNENIFHTLKL